VPLERWLYILRLRTRSLVRGRAVDRELDDELRYHLERKIEEYVAHGLTLEDARSAALRAMGGVEQRKEECRDRRRVGAIEHFGRDLRYAARLLRSSPGFTIVAVLSLALGIGANTAIFQLLNAVRLRSLPVSDPRSLAVIQIADRGWPRGNYAGRYGDLTYPQWERIRDRQQGFSGVLAWSTSAFDLAARGESRFTENGLWVSGNFFTVLGIRAEIGRVFTSADDVRGCGAPGVVLSHDFWRRDFGSIPSAVGSTITVNGHPLEVIGVAAAGFYGIEVGRSFDLAVPLCADQIISGAQHRLEERRMWWLGSMGRLKEGTTLAQANARLASISGDLFRETVPERYPADDARSYQAFRLEAVPGAGGYSQLRTQYDTPLWMLLALAGTVLLIACANLANLLLARMGARAREVAVRLALGASRGRVVRQLLTESLLLTAMGCALALWLAGILGRAVVALISSDVDPMFVDLTPDWRLLAFAGSLAGLTCALFGLAPALRATRIAPGESMKLGARTVTAGRSHARLRRVLVAAQLALALVLLVGGLLFGRSLVGLLTLDAGFQQAGILELDLDLRRGTLSDAGRLSIQRDVLNGIRGLPDVEGVASASNVPLVRKSYRHVFVDGATGRIRGLANFNRVSAGYFDTLRTTVVAGRDFDERDTASSPPVVIVNERFAQQFLAPGPVVGATFRPEGTRGEPGPMVQVVGLVNNAKYASLREDFRPLVYLAESQNVSVPQESQILIRTRSPLPAMTAQVQRLVESASADVSFHFHDFQQQIRYSLRQDQLMATLCGFFALLGADRDRHPARPWRRPARHPRAHPT
jgi:putative ABC transport system permease protein